VINSPRQFALAQDVFRALRRDLVTGEFGRGRRQAQLAAQRRLHFIPIQLAVLGLGEEDLVESDQERCQLGPVVQIPQRAGRDAGPVLVEHVVGDHDATVGQRRLGQFHVAVHDFVGVAAVHGEQADVAAREFAQLRRLELGRITFVHGHVVHGRPQLDVVRELLKVAVPGAVDVQLLVAEDVDRYRLFPQPLQQAQADEQLAVVHADLGDGARDLLSPLCRVENIEDQQDLGFQKAGHEPLTNCPVSIEVWLHRLAAYFPSSRFRSAASFCSTMSAKLL
jgi:hypothetical protein